jgi:translation initiation factor 1 (eIF-1/SUI1)
MIFIIAIYIKLDFARKKVTIIKGIDEVKNNR